MKFPAKPALLLLSAHSKLLIKFADVQLEQSHELNGSKLTLIALRAAYR